MERTLSSELFSESNSVNTQASMPLRVLANLMLWQRRISSRHQLARLDSRLLADAGNAPIVINFNAQRLHVKFKFNAFFARIFNFFLRARHIGFITAIGAGYRFCAVADGGTHAVHCRISAAQHHNAFVCHIDVGFFWELR